MMLTLQVYEELIYTVQTHVIIQGQVKTEKGRGTCTTRCVISIDVEAGWDMHSHGMRAKHM